MKTINSFLGDYYHNAQTMTTAVEHAISVNAAKTDIDNQGVTGIDRLAAVLATNPSLIIIGLENRLNPQDEAVSLWLTPELDKQLVAYVTAGGNLLVLHSGLASYPTDSRYIKMLGGHFVSHPDKHCDVRYVSTQHWPISVPIDYTVEDEFYIVKVDEQTTTVFMRSESKEHGKQPAGWSHNYGRGRVMCLVPTHNARGYQEFGHQTLLVEAIAYLLS